MTKLGIVIAMLLVGVMSVDANSEYLSPKKQLESGVLSEDIQCREDRVLVVRDNEKMACVKETTAEKRNWEIILSESDVIMHDDSIKEPVNPISTKDKEISTNKITIVGGQTSQSDIESSIAPQMYAQPWTTITYPEEFIIGEPFTIDYTWTFLKSYSEANGDEWPQDNLEKYPWAQEWQPYEDGEDENGNIWWKIKKGHERHSGAVVTVFGHDVIQVLTEEFGPHDWKGEPHFPPVEGYLDEELVHPWDLEDHSASVTLQIDEPITPPDHGFRISVGTDDHYVFFVHFNDGVGYIGTSGIKWFDSDLEILSTLAEVDLVNPYTCLSDYSWNLISDEQKRWEYVYPITDCVGKTRASSSTGSIPTEEELLVGWKDWLDRNNITENIREYLSEQIGLQTEEIERFFEKYPHLKGLFILPSFSFLPDAFATHGDHLIVARGTFLISDLHGNPISPIGTSVCLYDQRNNDDFEVLKYGNKDACKIIKDSTGTYSIIAVNTDPDDNSGVDLTVGLKSENNVIRVTDYGKLDSTDHDIIHGDGEIIKEYAPTSNISYNVPKNSDQILTLPSVTLGSSNEFSRVYYFTQKIFDAHKYIKDNFSTTTSQVTVEYEASPFRPHGGNHYHRTFDIINLEPNSDKADFTIQHEYGHHVMKSVYVDKNNGDYPNSPGGPHSIESKHTSRELVWTEGWADYFVSLVTTSATFRHGYTYDFENRNYRDPIIRSFDPGDLVEGNIASILWDLTDGAGEPDTRRDNQDTIANLKQNIWNIFDTPALNSSVAPQETFDEFIAQWGQRYPEHNINKVLLLNTYIR